MENSNENLGIAKRILMAVLFLALAFVLMLAGEGLGELIVTPLAESGDSVLEFMGKYAAFIGIWIVLIAFVLIVRPLRPMISKLGRKESGNRVWKSLLLGLTTGIGLNLLVALVASLCGNITLTYVSFDPLMFFAFLLAVTIQSGAEELVARWFIYENVKRYFGKTVIVPILLNATFFMAMHLGNDGITLLPIINLFLVGILYSEMIFYFNCFWGAVAAHATWNFCQNILLGLPNSGTVSAYSVFALDTAAANDGFAYNTAFGIEGTVMATLLLAGACVVLFLLGRKRQAKAAND